MSDETDETVETVADDSDTQPRSGSKLRASGMHWVAVPYWLQDVEDDAVDAYVIAVFAAIARHAKFGTGTGAFPGRKTIAAHARCSVTKVKQSIAVLIRIGAIERTMRAGKSPEYVVHYDAPEGGRHTPPPAEGGRHTTGRGSPHDREGGRHTPPNENPLTRTPKREIATAPVAGAARSFDELPIERQLFSAVAWACGSRVDELGRIDPPPTKTEARRIGKAVQALLEVDATVDDVKRARFVWRLRYGANVPAPESIVGRWSQLQNVEHADVLDAASDDIEAARRLRLIESQ